jgi:hypothetical protein
MTTPDAKAEFLRGLVAADFLPDGDAVGAVAAATGMPLADESGRGRHRAAVEAFAREYWSLAPDERGRRWNELFARGWADDRGTAARLAHLKAGLAIEPADYGDPVANALAPIIRDLYVLPPRERAVFRNARYESRDGDPHAWGNAAVKLRHAAPELVALEPLLLQKLIDAAWPPERELTPEQAFSLPTRPARIAPVPKSQGASWNGCMVAFAVITLLRLFASLGDRSDTTPSYTPTYSPTFTPRPATFKSGNTPPPRALTGMFSEAEVGAYRKYEAFPSGTRPPGYDAWVALGKPDATPPPKW